MLDSSHLLAVSDQPKEAPIDYLTLAEFLSTLGYPVRLALLDKLRLPHKAAEIKLTPHRVDPGHSQDRPLARQTVQSHLDKLVEHGLVLTETTEEGGRTTTYYTANPSRLYALLEDMRRLTLRYAGSGQGPAATGTIGNKVKPVRAEGPRLLLVHGVYEGKVFRLDGESAVDGAWTIGRRKGLPIALDYDPYVSTQNAVIERDGDGFLLRDLEKSKNGTLVNWHRLERGSTHELRSGDVIGVGKSLLSFIRE